MPKKTQATSRTKPAGRSTARSSTKSAVKSAVKSSAKSSAKSAAKSSERPPAKRRVTERVESASTPPRNGGGSSSIGKAGRPRLAFADALAGLRSLLEAYRDRLEVVADSHDTLMLNCSKPYQGKPLFFAGVTHRRSYVSFYLMPIYTCPELSLGLSPALLARKQGKSCFNFTARDELLFAELRKLTERGFEHFAKQGFL